MVKQRDDSVGGRKPSCAELRWQSAPPGARRSSVPLCLNSGRSVGHVLFCVFSVFFCVCIFPENVFYFCFFVFVFKSYH